MPQQTNYILTNFTLAASAKDCRHAKASVSKHTASCRANTSSCSEDGLSSTALCLSTSQPLELRTSARPHRIPSYTYQQISYVFISRVETYLMQLLLHIKTLENQNRLIVR